MQAEDKKEVLLVLSPGFPANEGDTTCLPAQQSLILSINKAYPSLHVIIFAFEYPHTTESYSWFGNEVIPLGGQNRGGLARLMRWIKAWRRLLELKNKYRLMGLLSFWLGQCGLVGKYFGQCYQLAHFTWILGQDAREGNRYVRWIRPKENSLIAISDFLTKQMFRHYGLLPEHIIPNGIDPLLFEPFTGRKDIDVIGVGSLIPLKQYTIFIEVIQAIKKDFPSLKVLLCGEGAERENLTALIRQYDLERTISITGEKTHPEVLQLLQRSKIMLHPSSYEGFSGACLEALYAGAHVISFQQPMDGWIRHWHIAENTASMKVITRELLLSEALDHTPVLPYTMLDTAKNMIHLFTR